MLQLGLLGASIPVTFAIIAFGGGTPQTSGMEMMVYAGFVSSAFTVLEQLKEIREIKEDKEVTA